MPADSDPQTTVSPLQDSHATGLLGHPCSSPLKDRAATDQMLTEIRGIHGATVNILWITSYFRLKDFYRNKKAMEVGW